MKNIGITDKIKIKEVIFMNIKRIIGEALRSLSNSMIKCSAVSFAGTGIEEMPESMKKLR